MNPTRSATLGRGLAFLILAALSSSKAWAEVRPHALISEGMVLQRDRQVPIWGTADPGETIVVRFRGQEAKAVAERGRWSVRLESGAAGGPFTLTISGKNALTLSNVLVGEVWLCGGQSNMGWPFAPRPGSRELEGTGDDQLRLLTVPERLSETTRDDLPGARWLECGPATVGPFSAVAYHFARDLRKTLNVPVGLIHASYGGSSARQWINPEAIAGHPELEAIRGRPLKPVLYLGMIAPLVPYGIRGAIWYQGEADTGAPSVYRALFPALIRGWRGEWGQGDFPFLFVQLAPHGKIVREPQDSAWAELREAQRLTSLTVPGTGMAVITDCGHETRIHPEPKRPVGQRLARLARSLVYHQPIVASGPSYSAMHVQEAEIVLDFRDVGSGLVARTMVLENVVKDGRTGETGGALHVGPEEAAGKVVPLQGFTIAGKDRRFVNARAEIRGARVVVWSPEVALPVAVLYGWTDYPTGNLFNGEGLPASPFRTDDFPFP
jgi:sialate O-acetylesterase